jgi:hypothetical protein
VLLRPLRWGLSLLTTIIGLYVFFFVPIGSRPLYEHVKRIAATPEARDLGRDVTTAGERVGEKIRSEVRQGLLLDRDGGVYRPDRAPDEPAAMPLGPPLNPLRHDAGRLRSRPR